MDVARQLHSAALRLLRLLRLEDATSGIGPARLSALSVLVFGGPRTLGELAAAEGVKAPTMSRIVAALVAGKLVRRHRPPADRRTLRLEATAAGRRLMLAGRDRRVARLADLLRDEPAEELALLARAATLLAAMIERRSKERD